MSRTLKAPQDTVSLSIAGVTYDVAEDGYVEVADAHVSWLTGIGFVLEDRPSPEVVKPSSAKGAKGKETPWSDQ